MVKDCIGQKVTKGTILVYPVRQTSDLWMSMAVYNGPKRTKNTFGDKITTHTITVPTVRGTTRTIKWDSFERAVAVDAKTLNKRKYKDILDIRETVLASKKK